MNKYLKLFETEDDFKSCLEAKIAGNNTEMGFPNVSVIGEEDSNGNFSASDVFYIKDLTKAEAVREYLRLNDSHWVNPTNINIISGNYTADTLHVSINNHAGYNGYDEDIPTVRFQPYDWYDKKTNTTYYAFIAWDAYENIMSNSGNINVLDGQDVALNLLEGYNGYSPNIRLSNYNPSNEPPYHGKIIYVTDLSDGYPNDIYERTFNVVVDNDTATLIFDAIKSFDSDGYSCYGYRSTYNFSGGIEGYVNSGSGSGNGNS